MSSRHMLQARQVKFDLARTSLHWIPADKLASHMTNAIHLLLPEGELWFCRVYNQALPFVTDPELRADVEGFIRQEAVHSRAHTKAQQYLKMHGINPDGFLQRVNFLFRDFLGDAPLGLSFLQRKSLAHRWLVTRVGLIAAIEHFTGILGQWAMDNTSWDRGDPVMADLFKWHLAEEVEHRTVAFDLYRHLCKTDTGFYLGRQALMAVVYPLFFFYVVEGTRFLARQDSDRDGRKIGRWSLPRVLWQMEKSGRRTDYVPAFSLLTRATLRWVAPGFHPVTEGNTEQALAYIARSPAANRGATQQAA